MPKFAAKVDANQPEIVRDLRRVAVDKGFRSLAEDGIDRVLDGTTSIAELSRSVDLTGRLL